MPINIILPALAFFIAVVICMTLIGVLQRNDQSPLKVLSLIVLILLPAIFMQVVGFFVRDNQLPASVYPYAMSAYLIMPFPIIYFFHKRTMSESAIYSCIILVSALCGGAAVSFFIH